MSGFETFLWTAGPYIAFTILIVGTALRRVFFARTWTSKSSEFLEKKHEKIGNPIFHAAILFVFLGHVGGVLIPKVFTDTMGLSEPMYHSMAFLMGGIAGIALVAGYVLLAGRRFGGNKRMKANTSTMDKVLYVFLGITILSGMVATFSNAAGAFNYRETISPWFRSLFALQPQADLMATVPLAFRIHMCCWMVLFSLLPFTRLVHLFSGITAPFKYIGRAAIIYRRRAAEKKVAANERVLEFPDGLVPRKE